MSKYSVQLLAKQPLAEGTMAFHFSKPDGFTFTPGQAADLIIADESSAANTQDARHTFSMVSAPHENELVFATRMRDSLYKQQLKALPLGATAFVDGPFGALVLGDDLSQAAVCIAGGIGITPFMSMLRDAAERQRQQDILLLYSNRRPEDSAFLAELQELSRRNPRFKLIATMTNMDASAQAWDGATGYLNAERIQAYSAALHQPQYYLSGPPMLVEAMMDVLDEMAVAPDAIRSEGFLGY